MLSFNNLILALGSGGPSTIGGLPLGTIGSSGIYNGYTLSAGDDFKTLDLVSNSNPKGKYFTTRTYQGTGGGCRAPATGGLAVMYDVSPDHTGWNDANRGIPIATLNNSHQIVTGEGTGALRLRAIRQSNSEQALLNTGVAGQIERAAMISGISAFWWDSPALIEWRAALPVGPHGQHPDMWGLSANPPNGPNFNGNEYGWECGNSKSNAYHNNWIGGVLTQDALDINNYRDGLYHKWSVVLSTTDYKFYVDDVLVKTSSNDPDAQGNLADHMLITHHILNQSYQSQIYTASEWDLANTPNGAIIDVEWFRVWRQTGANHYKPISTILDVQTTANAALNIALPSQTTLWGANGLVEYVTCVQNEVLEPGSNNTAGYAQFPSGISYNVSTRVLSGTMPTQSGALYVVVGVKGDGNTCEPSRFRITVAPVYKGTGSYSYTKNTPVSFDAYLEWDVGCLFGDASNPKGIVITGLPTGLSFSGSTGLITGTPTSSGSGTVTASATNNAGQTTTVNISYITLDPALGAVAPTLTGNPTLLASWDFDQTPTINTSGSLINSISGADGTSIILSGSGGTRPTITTRNPGSGIRGAVDIASANSAVLTAASSLGLGTGGCTIILIVEPKATNLASTVFEIDQASANATTNRHAVGTGTGTTGWGMRKCGATGGNQDANQGVAYTASPTLVIGVSKAGSASSALNINGVAASVNSAGAVLNAVSLNQTILGARSVTSALNNFFNGYVWRVLVYAELTATNKEEIATWANTNYGTQNLA